MITALRGAEAGGWLVWGQTVLCNKTLSLREVGEGVECIQPEDFLSILLCHTSPNDSLGPKVATVPMFVCHRVYVTALSIHEIQVEYQ